MTGFAHRAIDYVAAQRRRRELAQSMNAFVKEYDAVVTPCLNHTAAPMADAAAVKRCQMAGATTAFNISGHPALSLRTGFDEDGLPTSAQIVGRYFDEASVLRVAQTYERARDWHTVRPMTETGATAKKETVDA
jgi:aspartyl-tRNA(Asn)/glutamyl-tRNA(Gln) amidotransferase subunit A